jgi:hypothetical protein
MPATYTKEVILTGDTNPQGDSYTINNLDNVSWVTTSTNNAGVNPVISFTIADWTGSQGSTRAANFAVRHWLYDAGDPQAIHEATFTITQYAENQVVVTTTQATAATTQATAATTQSTAATTQSTAATTQATAATTQATAATTELGTIALSLGQPPVVGVGGISGNLPFTVTGATGGVTWSLANSQSSLGDAAKFGWVTDLNGTTFGNIPIWITNVSAQTDSSNAGILSYSVEDQTNTGGNPLAD